MARKMKTMDGNTAAAHVSYAFTEVAAIYPITPSSNMGEVTDLWASEGKKNLFGQPVKVVEMQSEAGAAGAVHGSLAAGALTTTYTASQGLLLMIPNMYKMAGELLPSVIHVSARTLASHALSIFGDHQDVYACRQTGYAILAATNPQEVMDLGAVAHLSAIKGRVPFVHFFDGFRTSHEYQKVAAWETDTLKQMLDHDAVEAFRARALNPQHPTQKGSVHNPDVFFQARESSNKFYNALPAVVEEYMAKVNAEIGTDYQLFNYYGAPDAEHVIIAMGSVCDTIQETVDYLNANGGKCGLLKVRLYRPFVTNRFVEALPKTVKQISVLDRTKEPGSIGEPLYLDVVAALRDTAFQTVPVLRGRYGLASKDTTPAQIMAVYQNATKSEFTIGIEDDVTHLSLPVTANIDTTPNDITSCKFWGLGADGTVGANKNSCKIIGDNTDLNVQAYFSYDSKKSGGITVSHLRFGKSRITSTYLISQADFVACHNPSYVDKYDMVSDLKPGGTFLLNCSWNTAELEEKLPGQVKRYLAENNINFYTIDGVEIGREIGLGGRINTVLQSAFFKLTGIIPVDQAITLMKDAATKTYGKKGEKIVQMNHDAIDQGATKVVKVEVPDAWKTATDTDLTHTATGSKTELVRFINDVLIPVAAQKGDDLPVSTFVDREDGVVPMGTSTYEKRGIAIDVPEWQPENCIQCNFCSYVCPHAVIRPFALTAEESAEKPEGMPTIPMTGLADHEFYIGVSAFDCTGCGSCANVCPGKKGNKALLMKPLATQEVKQDHFAYAFDLPEKPAVAEKFKETTVKGSQFKQPLLEFSGACAGCGETPYAKLVTQLYGDRMYIANATGCSSIWGGSFPSNPYTVDKNGNGPTWGNSLFEDNAEYGYGMFLAQQAIRERLVEKTNALIAHADTEPALKEAAQAWLDTYADGTANKAASLAFVAALESGLDTNKVCNCKDCCSETGTCEPCDLAQAILREKDYLNKKSIWIFGGDGWAYDIGFGGLDHVIASGEDVNLLVFDTEVYSNTGGQASKATPLGATAQFAAAGKEMGKKDLASMAMSYEYVYVAQVAQGADYNQFMKAVVEAESYPGPSLIIAYAPCIAHGIKGGMGKAQTEEKEAVAAGYWHLFRFDPRLAAEGKNPFQLDSKAPTASYEDFIRSEGRYASLLRSNPERADQLFVNGAAVAKRRYEKLAKLASEII